MKEINEKKKKEFKLLPFYSNTKGIILTYVETELDRNDPMIFRIRIAKEA